MTDMNIEMLKHQSFDLPVIDLDIRLEQGPVEFGDQPMGHRSRCGFELFSLAQLPELLAELLESGDHQASDQLLELGLVIWIRIGDDFYHFFRRGFDSLRNGFDKMRNEFYHWVAH